MRMILLKPLKLSERLASHVGRVNAAVIPGIAKTKLAAKHARRLVVGAGAGCKRFEQTRNRAPIAERHALSQIEVQTDVEARGHGAAQRSCGERVPLVWAPCDQKRDRAHSTAASSARFENAIVALAAVPEIVRSHNQRDAQMGRRKCWFRHCWSGESGVCENI